MISTTQLRIGNWLSFKGFWEGQVSGIRGGVIYIEGNQGVFMDENFDPVDLTPEVLEKSGFEWNENHGEYETYWLKNLRLTPADDYNVKWVTDDRFESDLTIIKHLHQLQNL